MGDICLTKTLFSETCEDLDRKLDEVIEAFQNSNLEIDIKFQWNKYGFGALVIGRKKDG